MKKHFAIACLLSLWVLLFTLPLAAQESEAALPSSGEIEASASDEVDIPSAQEVEINEDNYRQFMELKDPNLQREVIPENVFKPGSGLQKLEKLPEESQKHLRNELREIIVQGDPWQPGDEQGEFPYTPSVAASNNPGLEKQEKEAWGELVDSYNQREAQIHANSAGSQAARGMEDASGANPGDNQESAGDGGQDAEGSPAQQAGQHGKADQPDTTGTYSPNASNDPNARSTAGVSQNAMEFLQGLAKGGGGTNSSGEAEASGNVELGESPTPSETGSQTSQQQRADHDNTTTGGSPVSNQSPDTTSTAGASQNAMEFLKGNSTQGTAGSGAESSQANQGQGETRAGEQGQAQADGQQDRQEVAQAEAQGDGQAGSQDEGQEQDEQQTETGQTAASSIPPASTTPRSPAETEEDSTAGASQNALEYLTGEQMQATDSNSEDQAAGEPEGTLTIQELLNAQGVGASNGTATAPAGPAEQEQADEGKPDKDGGSH